MHKVVVTVTKPDRSSRPVRFKPLPCASLPKREFIIAPVLQEVIRPLAAKLYLEYPIEIDDHLSGTIDYLIRATQQLVVIEAKRGELDRGVACAGNSHTASRQ